MEAFEKWWVAKGQYEFSTYLTKEQSKAIWRGALAWVQGMMNENILNEALPKAEEL